MSSSVHTWIKFVFSLTNPSFVSLLHKLPSTELKRGEEKCFLFDNINECISEWIAWVIFLILLSLTLFFFLLIAPSMPGKKWNFWKVRVLEMLKGYHRKMPYWEMVHMIFTDLTVKLNSWQGQDGEWRYPSAQGPSDVIKRCQKTHKNKAVPLISVKIITYSSLMFPQSPEPSRAPLTENMLVSTSGCHQSGQLPKYNPITWRYTQILHKSPYRQSHVF